MAYPGCPVQMPFGLSVKPGCIKNGIAGKYSLPVRFNGYTENVGVGPGKAFNAVENLSVVFNTDIFLPVGRHARRFHGDPVRIQSDPPRVYFR